MSFRGSLCVVGVLCAPVLVASGCANPDDGAVTQVAARFHDAVAAKDGAAACDLLAPPSREELEQSAGEPCSQAILGEAVAPGDGTPHVEVYGTMGQVRWDGETTFLTRYPQGWLVLAAGCALPRRSTLEDTNDAGDAEAYECAVKN